MDKKRENLDVAALLSNPEVSQSVAISAWWVYMIRCANGQLYTGITTDVERRFAEHSAGAPKGAKYLRGKGPLTLVYREPQMDRSTASKREAAIKKLSKQQKLALLTHS